MSDRDMWFHKFSYYREDSSGRDPVTLLPTKERVPVLIDEPCDLIAVPRRVAVDGPGGRAYSSVNVPVLKIYPDGGLTQVPDENDIVVVEGLTYSVTRVQNFVDGGSNNYRGSRLDLERVETVDER